MTDSLHWCKRLLLATGIGRQNGRLHKSYLFLWETNNINILITLIRSKFQRHSEPSIEQHLVEQEIARTQDVYQIQT